MVLEEFPQQLVVCAHHVSDSYSTTFGNQRDALYNVSGIPHVQFDGLQSAIGAGSCSGAANTYRNIINSRLAQSPESPVQIEGVYLYDDVTVTAQVELTLVDPVMLTNPKVFVVVQEDEVGTMNYEWVTRDAFETTCTLDGQGDVQLLDHTFNNGGWDVENLSVVVFVQKMTYPYEMYQAAKLPLISDFDIAFAPEVTSVPEGNGLAELSGTVTNISDLDDTLTLSLDNTFGWPAEFKLEGEGSFHTTPSVIELGPGASADFAMRVTTDGSMRIGEGFLECHSSVTDRTGAARARVFNASPAVLIVDDDTNRADEMIILNNLNGDYLYDHYDVFNDHGASAPAFEDLNGYDIAIWHQGWNMGDRIQEADESTLMAFLDTGKGLILSSQDYLFYAEQNTFTQNYLGLASWTNDVDAVEANGVGGDPITDGMGFTINYPQQQLNRADHMEPVASAGTIFTNEIGNNIAVRNMARGGRTVTFAMALNGLVNGAEPTTIRTLLGRSIDWLMEGQSQGIEDIIRIGGSSLASIEPNPFHVGRNAASIQLHLSDAAATGGVTLQLLDVSGRLVRDMSHRSFVSGMQSLSWDGRDQTGHPVDAGVYYMRLATVEGTRSSRVVVMR